MKIFVAGASGAIGQPLVAELLRQGHVVTGMTRSDSGAEMLEEAGATVALASAFDGLALEEALRRSSAEVVIDELTALPKDPSDLAAAAPGDRKLRIEGGGNLFRAALAAGGPPLPATGQRLLSESRERSRERVGVARSGCDSGRVGKRKDLYGTRSASLQRSEDGGRRSSLRVLLWS